MKTIQRTMKYMVCLSLLLTVKQFASAGVSSDMGPGNGGGNGGNGFLMQEMKAANPSLSAQEIILKAFNDSEGQVPKLHRVNNSNVFHFSAVRSVDDLEKVKTNNIMIKVGSLEIEKIQPYFSCKNLDLGPLLSDQDPVCKFSSIISGLAFNNNNVKKTSTGLTVQFKRDGSETRYHSVYEFRKLSEREVIFVRYSWNKVYDEDVCYDIPDNSNGYYKAINGICSVGYIWNEN